MGNSSEIQHNQLWLQKYHFFDKTDVEGDLGLAKIRCDIMSSFECPPTPPTLPEGEAAITPPPKSPPRLTSDEDTSRDQNTSNNTPTNDANKNSSTRPKSPEPSCAICLGNWKICPTQTPVAISFVSSVWWNGPKLNPYVL